jgi:hypothetical protein
MLAHNFRSLRCTIAGKYTSGTYLKKEGEKIASTSSEILLRKKA